MQFTVLKETANFEKRVALTPDVAKKFIELGHSVVVQKDAGVASGYLDTAYEKAGCVIEKDTKKALKNAQVLLSVTSAPEADLAALPKGSLVIGMLKPFAHSKEIKNWGKTQGHFFSMEMLPRITRAQSMDVLSSQSNLAGYKAVVDAASLYGRAMPLMMTAAGTVAAARVLVIGAGVAGLQAIATAKRLGAIVSAFDVRTAAKEQVESLGATFVQVESAETGDGGGGYAKEMSDEYKKAQAQKLADTIKTQDIIITTAQIPGRPAPVLVTKEMVASMKPGSVIIDLAGETGGNCAFSQYGQAIVQHDVTIVAPGNMPSQIAGDASQLYARNLLNFVKNMLSTDGKELAINWDDEIIKGTCLIKDGDLIHPQFA